MFEVNGKIILVVGASQGIGFALAKHFSLQGATVVAASRTYCNALKDLGIDFQTMDVSSTESVINAFSELAKRYEHLDVLINCAGIVGAAAAIDEVDSKEFEKNYNTNVIGMTRCIKSATPLLRNGSSIINTASLSAHLTVEDYSSYSLGKAAIIQLTKNVAMQFGKRGIRVNSISPGTVLTPMEPADGVEAKLCERSTALGRPAKVDDLFGTYQYLASSASNYVTGIDIRVDGGWIAGVSNKLAAHILS